jgi:UDP-N-acetylmuramoyl-tripeptide--D-alanyl-D-alanine ligase
MMQLAGAAKAIGGRVVGADVPFAAVASDSRNLPPGALFVAIRGERFDGHDFVGSVQAGGAAAAMVSEAWARANASALPLLAVDDPRLALGRLAAAWRRCFPIPVVSVVGSNGKTTVKEMIACCLREHYGEPATLATVGNLNNDIGLPLTVLRLRETHRAAVFEMGMNHTGETAWLASIAQATVALVNNAQREHQEFMKSVEDVAREHAASFAALPADGVAVVNADDAHCDLWRAVAAPRRVLTFALDHPADVRCAAHVLGAAQTELTLVLPAGGARTTLAIPGVHNVRNALAAAAAASAAGASPEAIARGLAAFRPVKGRLQVARGTHGATVIDDSYNANPDSVLAAIDVLAAAAGPRLLVLGDMGEVGEQGRAFHEEVGEQARARGIDRLLAAGELAREAVRAFGPDAEHFADVAALAERVQALAGPGVTVLVKGSRFMRMERVVAALTNAGGEAS